MKTVMGIAILAVVVATFVSGASASVTAVPVDPEFCFEEGWKIDPGTYFAQADPRPTYGTFFNRWTHEEFLWVHSGTNIDFYDLTNKDSFDMVGSPTLAYSIPAGSSCRTANTQIIGDDAYTIHGEDVFCTCNWRPEAPCPSRLEITIDGASQLVALAGNTNVPVDSISPDVTGLAAIPISDGSDGSPPNWGCTEITNPEEIAGKYCVADRGGCFFQTKYDNCMNAGALAAIVVNRDSSVLSMGVRSIQPGDVFFMIGLDSGQIIKDGISAGKEVTLSAGRGVGPPAPLPEYSAPDPLGVVNVYTGKRDLDTAPFILGGNTVYDYERKLMYVFQIDGNRPAVNMVMNITTVVDGTFPVLGTFPSSEDRSGWTMFKNDRGTFLVETVAWQDLAYIWDVNGRYAASPRRIATINFQVWCPDLQWRYSGMQVHPSGDYVYAAQGLRSAICPDYDGDGSTGDYVQEIYDVSNPYNPQFVKGFIMNEVEEGAVTLNGGRWEWGPNGQAGISMTSGGFVLYDFSDPENPVAISEIYDPAENTNDFTKGVFSSRYGDDGFWYVYEKDGVDGVHGEFHQLKAVPCDKPAVCKQYD